MAAGQVQPSPDSPAHTVKQCCTVMATAWRQHSRNHYSTIENILIMFCFLCVATRPRCTLFYKQYCSWGMPGECYYHGMGLYRGMSSRELHIGALRNTSL